MAGVRFPKTEVVLSQPWIAISHQNLARKWIVIVVDVNRSTTASHICRMLERVGGVSATGTATFATAWRESVWTVRVTRRVLTASSVSRAGTALPQHRTVPVRFLLLYAVVSYKSRLKPGLWSRSRRLGFETVSRRTNVSSRFRLEKKCQRLGLV